MTTERQLALADEMAEADRTEGLYQARVALAGEGCADCTDCGEPIEHLRRVAMPNATRCIECQSIFESKKQNGR